MKWKNNILALLILASLISFKTAKEDVTIPWAKDRKLIWDDFKGKPDSGSPNAAMTDSGFGFSSGNYIHDSVPLTITNCFDKNKSWVKKKQETDELLAHEQCHFDITELFTRKLKKQLLAAKFKNKTFEKAMHDLYEKNSKEWHDYQNLYDKETNHSKITDKQLEWEQKVAKDLSELDEYGMTTLSVFVGK